MNNNFESRSVPEQHNNENEALLNNLESSLEKIKITNPDIYSKFDIESLKKMEGFSEKEKLDHIESIKEEFLNNLSTSKKNEIITRNINWKPALISLIALINSFSVEPASALPEKPAIKSPAPEKTTTNISARDYLAQRFGENKEDIITEIKEVTVRKFTDKNRNYEVRIKTVKNATGKSDKFLAIYNKNNNRIFAHPESPRRGGTLYEDFDIGSEKIPTLLFWDIPDKNTKKITGIFYKWDGKSYSPYRKNVTDKTINMSQRKEIIQELERDDTNFQKIFNKIKKYVIERPKMTDKFQNITSDDLELNSPGVYQLQLLDKNNKLSREVIIFNESENSINVYNVRTNENIIY